MSEFSPAPRNRDGYVSYCRPCQSARVMASWHRASDETRERRTKRVALSDALRKYGPKGVVVAERREAGEGCDVCGNVTIRMAIDHCHETHKVRGLLCMDCNIALGLMKDDPDRLRALAAYAEAHTVERV